MSYIKPSWRELLKENNGVIPPMVAIRVINETGDRVEVGTPFKVDDVYQMRILYEQRFIGLAPTKEPITRPPDSGLASSSLAEPASGPAPTKRRR